MVPVKVGDVVEFAPLLPLNNDTDDGGDPLHIPPPKSLATGRVVDVDALADSIECVVQVSPFEPLQRLRLKDAYYKVCFSAMSVATGHASPLTAFVDAYRSCTRPARCPD